MDIHHHFHPVGYMFPSNEDVHSYVCLLESLRNLYVKLFGNEPNVHYALNDNSDAIFKAFKTVFPLAFLMNCFAHMIHEEEDKHLFIASNIKCYMRKCRKNKKVDDQLYMNMIKGIKKWARSKYTMHDINDIIDDNKIIVVINLVFNVCLV